MAPATRPPTTPSAGPPLSRTPVVGITPCLDEGRLIRSPFEYLYLNRNYARALASAGAAPFVLCPDTPAALCAAQCDGLVLSGGGDLPPSFADPGFESASWRARVPGQAEALERIVWERELLDAFAGRGKPVLGVCFGMQLMNLHFGGTLHADLREREPAHGGRIAHGGAGESTSHALTIADSSSFFAGWTPPRVSSSHGQGVRDVAPGFAASAWAPDGLVEAIEAESLIGVEWHPESDASAQTVYSRFVALVERRLRARSPGSEAAAHQ